MRLLILNSSSQIFGKTTREQNTVQFFAFFKSTYILMVKENLINMTVLYTLSFVRAGTIKPRDKGHGCKIFL